MTEPRPGPSSRGPRVRRSSGLVAAAGSVAWLVLAGLVVGACDLGTPASTAPTSPTGAGATVESSPSNPTETAEPGQTDTDWGRIWDSLPVTFPVYPGATPADDAATEVVSATFAVEGVDARTVAAWMQTELEGATYATEALNGPLENGGFILESVGAEDCRIQVAAAPLGGLTIVGVRYGAACPRP